ncbi:NAD(P)-dependent dehydrogenase [Enterococcus saigonensis]|uniref:NAD(P)-dependent dehydrogenase n=1 Tax=Enterococcus saigonensis TaxID=1805431 RepID=A0A679IHJ4_9ENTE|nr:3-oxoacyl-ACP reductase [Enterococcus saigonensis]BCA84725.1 NAD(P)-dependent dehydrogenase [Enterococcus saigonensis]
MTDLNKNEFLNRVVFVTGAASGIGHAQAIAFLEAGAKVFGVDIQKDFLPFFSKYGDHFKGFSGDVSKKETCLKAVEVCLSHFGQVDILLNTAGKLDDYKPLLETDDNLWQEILTTNLNSIYYLTKAVLPTLIKTKGTVINMCSIASLVAGGGGISYTVSKHAIAGFTKQLALDYAEKIHVVGIAPGAIQTPMNAADFAGTGEMAAWVADETPVKRWAQAVEVADLTLFLASDKARYMQGNIIPIDGGWLLK